LKAEQERESEYLHSPLSSKRGCFVGRPAAAYA
jgi:hypothetical protein